MLRFLFGTSALLLYSFTCNALNTGITLIQPKNNSVVSNSAVYFQWNTLSGALNYKLQIATEGSFQTIVDSAVTANNDTNISSLAFGQTYYWRVLVDTTGSGFLNLSNQYKFTLFTPPDLNSLQLWLNPDTGVTKGINDSVSNWADIFSSNISFSQSNQGNRPVWVDSVLNDHPSIRFDGSNDFLTAGDTLDLNSNSRTVFILGKNTSATGSYLAKSLSGNSPNRFGIFYFLGDFYFYYVDNSPKAIITTKPFGNYEIITTHIDRSLLKNKLFVNSSFLDSAIILGPSWNFNSSFRSLIGAYNDASDTGETLHLDGDIAEVIIYNDALNDSTRNLVEQYLRHKYSPPVNLGEDITIDYKFCDTTITADSGFTSYLWSTGATTQSISASVPGTYSVTVTDIFEYLSVDTIEIKHPVIQLKDTTICLGSSFIWDSGLDTLGYDFIWSTGATDSFIVISQAGDYHVIITDTIGAGCMFNSDTITVSIDTFSLVVSLGSADTVSLCAGNALGPVQGDSLVISYLWSTLDTTSTTTIDSTGEYWVAVKNLIGCVDSDSIFVNIIGVAPISNFVVSSVCLGDSTVFTDSSTFTPPDSIANWFWDFGDSITDTTQNPIHLYGSAGLYNVALTTTSDSGCAGTIIQTALVNELSLPNFSYGPGDFGCINNSVSFFDSSIVAPGDSVISWIWDFGDSGSSTQQNPQHTYTSAGTYSITLTINTFEGCSIDTSKNISIVSNALSPSDFTLICPLSNEMLPDSLILFQWNTSENAIYYKLEIATDIAFTNVIFQSGSIQNLFYSTSGLLLGYYYWRVKSFNACNDSVISNPRRFHLFLPTSISSLQLWLNPESGITKDVNDFVSDWADIYSSNISFTQPDPVKKPIWIDGVLNSHPMISYDGTNDVLSAGDTLDLGTSSKTIFFLGRSTGSSGTYFAKSLSGVMPNRYGLLYYPNDSSLLFNYYDAAVKDFTAIRSAGNFEILSYRIDRLSQENKFYVNSDSVGSISGIEDASYDFNSNYRFLLGAYNDVSDIGEVFNLNGEIGEVIIYNSALTNSNRGLIEQYLRHKYSPPVCLGADIVLSGFCGTTISADSVYDLYIWSTNDTTQSIAITQPGTYSVTVTDMFGYISSDSIEIYYPGNVQPLNDTMICLNDTITWNTQLDTSYTFQWSDSTETGSSLTIVQAGAYNVTITDSGGCFYYSDTINITIDSFEVVASLGPDDTLCAGNSLGLVQGASQAATYQWGCGSSATTPSILISISGTFCVTVTDGLGCEATDSVYIYVKGIAPNASFTTDTICIGDSTQFIDVSSSTLPDNIVIWNWDFGDTNTSSSMSPMHLYDSIGTYQVLLTVTTDSGCSDTSSVSYTVHPYPQAGFDPLNVCSNTPITMNDLSLISVGSVSNWTWYFETDTSTIQNPVYSFLNSGTASVTQIVSSIFGCTDSITQTVSVAPSPIPGFTTALSCGSNSVTFTDTSIIQSPYSLLSLIWDFGNASLGTQPSMTHQYANTGNYIITLTVQSTSGCSAIAIDTISVFPITINADFNNVDPCYNQPYQYFDNSTISGDNIISWEWTFDNAASEYDQNSYYTFADSGSFPVRLTVTSATGCIDSITKTVTVHGLPTANFDFSPKFGVNPLESIVFSNQSSGATSYLWMFGDANISTADTPSHAYLDTGIYQIVLHAYTSFNCSDSIIKTVDVRQPLLDVDLYTIDVDCQPSIIQNITLTLINRGTREVTSLDLFVRIDGGDPIREQWTGFLAPGESMSYTFNVDFPTSGNSTVNYVCSWLENPNGQLDEVAGNDKKCVACRNEFVIIEPFPNPSSGTVNFWFILPQDDFIEASMYDARGAYIGLVMSQQASKGLNELTVNTRAFTMRKGVYVIKFTYRDNDYMKSFVIQ